MVKQKILSLIALFACLGALSGGAYFALQAEGEAASSSSTPTYVEDAETTSTLSVGDYRLDFAASNLSFLLTNTKTNEILYSGRRANDDGLNSATWKGLMSDGLAVAYRNDGRTTLKPYSTLNGVASVLSNQNTLQITLNLRKISIVLEMDLTLNEDGSLHLSIPFSSIQESKKDETEAKNRYQLVYLMPYLALGDSYLLQQEKSFLFLPDGCGAIADLAKQTLANSEYDHRVYGEDIGMQGNNGVLRVASSAPEKEIKMPTFGFAYPDQAGVSTIIEGGAPYADIYASLAGMSTNYNFACARFNYREEYYRYVDRAGNGTNDFLEDPYTYDASLTYHFLAKGATLGTMADCYRSYLKANSLLPTAAAKEAALRLEYLVSESKATMFGDSEVSMTSEADVNTALADLSSADLGKPNLAFLGYQKGGWSQSDYSRFAYASALKEGSYRSFAEKANEVSFDFDYALPRSSAKGYGDSDLAMSISNQGIYSYDPLTYASSASTKERVLLNLAKTTDKFTRDVAALKTINNVSFSLKDFGTTLFSSHYGYLADRAQVASDYESLLSKSGIKSDLGMPNAYLLKEAQSIIETDVESSAYYLAPYSVPFYTMVLSGNTAFYSKPLNLNYEADMALRLIEYDVNPSFLLTGADSINLYQTSSSYLFSSQYSSWKDKIIALATKVKSALDPFRGSSMKDYTRLADGVSVSAYANGKSLYVNHTGNDYAAGSLIVPKEGYLIA